MSTFLKIVLGFVLGVICTIGVLFVIGLGMNARQSIEEPRNIQSFELSTKNGIVKLHTYMPKDSVQILIGRPQSTDVNDMGRFGVHETWEYKGRNEYTNEFTIEFTDGELKSVRQYRES
jgi:hypothetical protein